MYVRVCVFVIMTVLITTLFACIRQFIVNFLHQVSLPFANPHLLAFKIPLPHVQLAGHVFHESLGTNITCMTDGGLQPSYVKTKKGYIHLHSRL